MDAEGLIGRTFIGRFRIDRVLGRGGMATVYAAFDEEKGRNVALKVLKRELTRDAMVVRRFEREAKAASHLRHPNVVEVVEWGSQGEDAFIAMELAEGTDLLKALSQERPMRQGRAILILAQVCSALAAAHAKGIVHRDLKPENILLVPDPSEPGKERAKVLDFGIAKILDQPKDKAAPSNDDPPSYVTKTALTRVGTIVGTPAYMSPEQCRGGDIDGRSDIYATGVLLYQLVTGELPFSGETPLHTAMRHIHAQPRPPHELRRDLSSDLSRIILRALAKWPGERPQTAEALRDELLDALPNVPDGKSYTVPDGWCGRTTKPDADDGSPPTAVPRGGLGAIPLKAVRLGRGLAPAAPASTAPETLSPHTTQPDVEAPPPNSVPAKPTETPTPIHTPKVDDDDEPRTFLIAPDPGRAAQRPEAAAQPIAPTPTDRALSSPPPPEAKPKGNDDDPGTITREHNKPAAGRRGTDTGASAPPATALPRTAPLQAARPAAPTAPVQTAPLMAAPRAPSAPPAALRMPSQPPQPAARAVPRTIVSAESRTNEARVVARTERSGGRASAAPPAKPQQNTETGLTPTNLHATPPAGAATASAVVAGLPPPRPTPAVDNDDDEPATYVREPGPASKKTLVMDEPSQANPALAATVTNTGPAPVPVRQPMPQHAAAAAAFSAQRGRTPDPHEAEALRALKATSRIPDEPTQDPFAAVKATVRMNPVEALAHTLPQQVSNGPASQPVPSQFRQLPSAGWTESTVVKRPQRPAPPPTGVVGQLRGLSGTTGLLIGLGLGLGIAAGLIIAFLLVGLGK